MRRSTFSDDEILGFVRDIEAGRPAAEVALVAGASLRTLYRWRRRYSGLKPFAIQALRRLEQENHRLRSAAELHEPPVATVAPPTALLRSDVGGGFPAAHHQIPAVVGRYAALRLR